MEALNARIEKLLFAGPRKGAATATVIGSGGKTSLIWHLAGYFAAQAGRKVLVTPTTKMLVPAPEGKPGKQLYDRYYNHNEGGFIPEPGITLAGCFNESSGKLEGLPGEVLEEAVSGCDIALIEGDGAKGLPLKAWDDYEPVVPPFTTLTIGVLPIWPLGKPLTGEIAHRLPLFCGLTGAVQGEPLKPEHIAALITGGKTRSGLFAKARGEKLLFFSQIEDEQALKRAKEIAGLLPAGFREGLCGVIAGSVLNGRVFDV